jgi:hypothetical protein
MNNPWLDFKLNDSTIHEIDGFQVDCFNENLRDEKFRLSNSLLPDPYIGNINSKVLLLALNPGLSAEDYLTHDQDDYKKLHWNNLMQGESDYPFYYLNPELDCPGTKWWHSKLKELIGIFGLKLISKSIYCLQYAPYHSERFKKPKLLPTQSFTKCLLENHIKKGLPIVIMRSNKIWVDLVPELNNYDAFKLRNPRNPTLSSKNMGEANFRKLVKTIYEN